MRWAWMGVCTLVCVGCGGGDAEIDAATAAGPDAPSERDAPSTSATDAGPSSTTTITAAAGGTATSLDGLFEILVAPGALSADTEIVITRVADADVPADIAATDPISAVYSVEPDGLTFGGDGAFVHYHWGATPTSLMVDGRFGAAFAVSQPGAGGAPEWQPDPHTIMHEGQADLLAPLAHLSYQWAVGHDANGDDYYLGVTFDDPHEARVGDRWSPAIDVQATVSLRLATVAREVAAGSALGVERGVLIPADGTFDGANRILFGASAVAKISAEYDVGAPPLAPDRPHDAGSSPRFYCASVGQGYQVLSATLEAEGRGRVRLSVSDPEPTRCLERTGPEVRILDTFEGVRDDTSIATPDPATLEAEVETRTSDTHTYVLAPPWYATYDRPGGAPTPGPDTITATNAGGATMTATRDGATGEYHSIIDAPDVWSVEAQTAVTFGGLPTPRVELMPAPPVGIPFGPVDGLDTMVHGSDAGELELSIRFPGTLRCGADDVSDFVIFRRLEGSSIAVPLREGLALAATQCGRTVEDLVGAPFVVEVTSLERAQLATADGVIFVSIGHGLRVDGTAFTTICPPGQTYCFDRCTNTTTDPLNCGSCGGIPLEVCDTVDNDCDGSVDEGCPTTLFSYSGDDQVSPHYGDTTTPSGTANNPSCRNAIIGLCGSTNADGSLRQIRAVCGSTTLRTITTTTPYSFAIDVAELAPGTCETGTTGGGASFGPGS